MIENERKLAGLAYALIGKGAALTKAEQRLVDCCESVSAGLAKTIAKAIRAGDDPLGTYFCILRSPEVRREDGATYTPPAIVTSMIAWAAGQPVPPVRIVDPGSGSGRFLIAAARQFPEAQLVAVETDPLALLLLRANARVCGFQDRLTIKAADYREVSLPDVDGPTLYIGNPPYVRHHDISERWKDWFSQTAKMHGFKASKLAGLHIHFFLKTRTIGRPGDYGAFITAAEWIDANYGSVLRDMLSDGLGGASLHVINPTAKPFADALTTGAITCFKLGARSEKFAVRTVDTLDDLADLSQGVPVAWSALKSAPRWSIYVRNGRKRNAGEIELGELFRVHRGQVTGANSVWIAGAETKIPSRFLFPTVTKARELIAAGDALTDDRGLRRVIDLPVDLEDLTARERKAVDAFLDWARRHDTDKGYVAKNRRAWWSVGLRAPAPILCTYMARRAPAFVRNLCGARHLNIAHGLYPREDIDEDLLTKILDFLSRNVCTSSGRIYAGGLAKFEPREVERLHIPSFDRLHEMAVS